MNFWISQLVLSYSFIKSHRKPIFQHNCAVWLIFKQQSEYMCKSSAGRKSFVWKIPKTLELDGLIWWLFYECHRLRLTIRSHALQFIKRSIFPFEVFIIIVSLVCARVQFCMCNVRLFIHLVNTAASSFKEIYNLWKMQQQLFHRDRERERERQTFFVIITYESTCCYFIDVTGFCSWCTVASSN